MADSETSIDKDRLLDKLDSMKITWSSDEWDNGFETCRREVIKFVEEIDNYDR